YEKDTLMDNDTTLLVKQTFPPLSATILNPSAYSSNKGNVFHRHPGFEMAWITSGSAKLSVDIMEFNLTAGMVYCIKPGQIYSLKLSYDGEGYLIAFTNEFISQQDLNLLSIYDNRYSRRQAGLVSISEEMEPFMRETI